MFKVGEKVVYPAHGVGQIEAIRSQVISGTEKRFYMLRILDSDMKIMIPVDNVDSVGLRKVIDRNMVSQVYKVLRQKKIESDQQTWNRRYREYTKDQDGIDPRDRQGAARLVRLEGRQGAFVRRAQDARHRQESSGERALDRAVALRGQDHGGAAPYLHALIFRLRQATVFYGRGK